MFYHHFSTPRSDELIAILEARWQTQQVTIEEGAVEMLERVTSSNIRKLVNINAEMSRVCELNSVTVITADLVLVATKTLLLDTTEGINSEPQSSLFGQPRDRTTTYIHTYIRSRDI